MNRIKEIQKGFKEREAHRREMMDKQTKKYLKEENRWLWYHYHSIQPDTKFMEVRQYDKKGELIAMSSGVLPLNKYRPKHPVK